MTTTLQGRREPLGLFPNRSTPRLYDRIGEVWRVRHCSRRTEEACLHWIRRVAPVAVQPGQRSRKRLAGRGCIDE